MTGTFRTAHGQFMRGSSGNPRGRSPQTGKSELLEPAVCAAILDGANEEIWVLLPGRQRRVRMSRLEASISMLGSGAPRNRRSLVAYIGLVKLASQCGETMPEANPREYTVEDDAALHAAAESGDYDNWSATVLHILGRLTDPLNMSERELIRAMKAAGRGLGLPLPIPLENRLLELASILNRAIDREKWNLL